MTSTKHFSDTPVRLPEEDMFGMNTFAKSLAKSITTLRDPNGTTIAINGKWGSGKSSTVNLLRHHLQKEKSHNQIEIIDFKCWWFRGEEALTLAFLQELNTTLKKNLGKTYEDLIPKLGKKILQAGSVIGPAINIATASPIGSILGKGMDFTARFFPEGDSIESIFIKLSNTLADQPKRYLVIIDDIDRLSPTEVLAMFRLVKSVGRLPNILYLLVFDRAVAEKIANEAYPSEGPQYLEKIIQTSFEIPKPYPDEIAGALFQELNQILGDTSSKDDNLRFYNLYYGFIAHLVTLPRDVARLVNNLRVCWPPLANEVDVADFVALEALRLFEPRVHTMVSQNQNLLCGTKKRDDKKYTEFLAKILQLPHPDNMSPVEEGLKRLFPSLENVGYSSSFESTWEKERRVCSEKHFSSFFRMSLSKNTISKAEINNFIEGIETVEFVKDRLVEAVQNIRSNGKSHFPLMLDELNTYADDISLEKSKILIHGLFEIADLAYREEDNEGGFSIGDNHLRIHWLIRRLFFDKLSLHERSAIFLNACRTASIGWLADFTHSAWRDHYPREGKDPQPEEKCLTTKDDVECIKKILLDKIAEATKTNALLHHNQLASILFTWRDFDTTKENAVKNWTKEQISGEEGIAYLAKAFTGYSWSQSMGMFGLGDHVSKKNVRANIEGLDTLMDVEEFEKNLEKTHLNNSLEQRKRDWIETLLEAWKAKKKTMMISIRSMTCAKI